MTLSQELDYKLEAFNNYSHRECFSPIYGPKGIGDITDFANQEYFIRNVINDTNQMGVHVVCADGGFSVDGNEIYQEQLTLSLYLSQCYVGLSVLRKGGVFVCKFFDIYTNVSVSIIYLLYACFKEITIYKPPISRPGNSERYFIGKDYIGKDFILNDFHERAKLEPIISYLCFVITNQRPFPLSNLEMLPWSILIEDTNFIEYYKNRLYDIEQTQIVTIENILFQLQKISPPKLKFDQTELLLSSWNIHYNQRSNSNNFPNFKHTNQIFHYLMNPYDGDVIISRFVPTEKNQEWYQIHLRNNSKWHFIKICERQIELKCTLYACFIKGITHMYCDGKWVYNNLKINLPLNTVILAVLVPVQNSIVQQNTLFVLDAIMINNKQCIEMSFAKRQKKIKTMIKVVSSISDGIFYKNFVNIHYTNFISDELNKQISYEQISNQCRVKESGALYLAINEKSLVDKCLFYK